MRKLLDFLIRKRHWFLFLVLEIVSLVMIYRSNAYQRNIIFSSGNVVTGKIASVSGSIQTYLNLREVNKDLMERNGLLEIELLRLQDQMDAMLADTVAFSGYTPDSTEQFNYEFIKAEVVSNSISGVSNYITVNKGRKDGIAPDMGVVSSKGVVGIVSMVSDHFSVILSVLNPKFRLSCKVLRTNNFGSLTWGGRDPKIGDLEELPRHVVFHKGDTIVTSGYSAIFPSGIRVGRILRSKKQRDDNFYTLEVLLDTDFTSLQHVRIIKNYKQKEQLQLEEEAKRND